jgi:hypothetical protein
LSHFLRATLLFAPASVGAQTPDLAPATTPLASDSLMALRWDAEGAPAECLSADTLAARVEDYMGRHAFDPASPRLLSVRVEPTPDTRLRAVVSIVETDGKVLGEREILTDDATCDALEEPLVLAIALLVDTDLGASSEPEPEAPPPEPEPPEVPEEPEAPEEAEEAPRVVVVEPPAPPEPWGLEVDASLVSVDGLLPSFGFGTEVGLFVAPPGWLPLRARVAGWLPQTEKPTSQGTLDFRLGLAGLMVCPLSVRSGGLGVDACAGADLVALNAESHGFDQARVTTQWFAQGSLALRVVIDLPSPWYAALSTGVGIPIRPPQFVIHRGGNAVPVFQPAEGTLVAGLGLGVRVLP